VLGCRRGTVGDGQLGTVESRTKLASICLGCFFQGGYSIVHSGSRMRADRVRHAIKLVQHQLPRRTIPLCLQGHRYRQRASKKSSAQPSGLPHTHCARHCVAVLCCAVCQQLHSLPATRHCSAVQCSALLCCAVRRHHTHHNHRERSVDLPDDRLQVDEMSLCVVRSQSERVLRCSAAGLASRCDRLLAPCERCIT
jgi:hypothetical protein